MLGAWLTGSGMNAEMFANWLDAVRRLTREQRRQALMMLASDAAEDDGYGPATEAFALADEPADGTAEALTAVARIRVEALGCPHCDAKDVRPWGHASGLPRYRCPDCRRTFNALTGTALARLRHKDRWPKQAQALMTGESVAEAATRCGVAYTTAFRWRHRFLAAPALDKPTRLDGIVEADETFILESFKGRRADLPRPARTRGGKPHKTGLSAEQIPVLVARDRAGATIDGVLPKLDRASVTAVLAGVVTTANQLCCDGGKAIAAALLIMCCQSPAARSSGRPICISTTSMPTTAGSRNGCVRSTASRRRTCPITSAGAERWRHSATQTSKASG